MLKTNTTNTVKMRILLDALTTIAIIECIGVPMPSIHVIDPHSCSVCVATQLESSHMGCDDNYPSENKTQCQSHVLFENDLKVYADVFCICYSNFMYYGAKSCKYAPYLAIPELCI